MNLQPVTGKPFVTMCRKCWKRFAFGTSTDPAAHPIGGYADLDGKPFEAYYCNACAQELRSGRVVITTSQHGMWRYLAHTGELFEGGKHFEFDGGWVLPMHEDEIRRFVDVGA